MNVTRSRLLSFALLLMIFTFLVSPPIYAQYAGGDGTESDPWQIATVEQLQSIVDNPNAHFILTADIDATSTSDWNDGLGFEPIGNSDNRFRGSLDGNGFSITDLAINRESRNNTGLFGVVQNSSLRNIILTDVEITGRNHTGGLVGMVLVDGPQQSGAHQITFDASNVASGVYFYRLHVHRSLGAGGQAGDQILTQKMTLIK